MPRGGPSTRPSAPAYPRRRAARASAEAREHRSSDLEDLHWIESETQALDASSRHWERRVLLLGAIARIPAPWAARRATATTARCPDGRRAASSGCAARRTPTRSSQRLLVKRGSVFLEKRRTLVETRAGWSTGVSVDTTGPGDPIPPTVQAVWPRASIGSRRRTSVCCRPPRSSARRAGRAAPAIATLTRRRCGRAARLQAAESCTMSSDLARRSTVQARAHPRGRVGSSWRSAAASCPRIVDAIERFHRDRLGGRSNLAHHALRRVWEKAVHYLRQAGLKATARSAPHEARGVSNRRWRSDTLRSPGHVGQGFEIRLDLRLG